MIFKKISIDKVVIYGSLAYDRIMLFRGRFKDYLIPKKIHTINLSFYIDQLRDDFGGTAGNVVYNLSLLKQSSVLLASVGYDFKRYRERLKRLPVVLKELQLINQEPTASTYIFTDSDDNQIAAFLPGAMAISYNKIPSKLLSKSLVLIGPGNPDDMARLVRQCDKQKTPFIYDPAQQIPRIKKSDLIEGIRKSFIFIGNDYEISLAARRSCLTENYIKKNNVVVRTLGARGSEIWLKGRQIEIPSVKPKQQLDPTGVGDAYRAGLIFGLIKDWHWRKSGNFASLLGSYAVTAYGTQNHRFSLRKIKQDYQKNFQESL